jgi:DNA-binding transcriptional MocR family regulator
MLDISPNWEGNGERPLYMRLYRYFREEIQSGRISSGTRLPSVRALSRDLHVSKTTVENAYHQLLAEGYIESRERSGFFVVELEGELNVHTGGTAALRVEPGAFASCKGGAGTSDPGLHQVRFYSGGFGGLTVEEMDAGLRLLYEVWKPYLHSYN